MNDDKIGFPHTSLENSRSYQNAIVFQLDKTIFEVTLLKVEKITNDVIDFNVLSTDGSNI